MQEAKVWDFHTHKLSAKAILSRPPLPGEEGFFSVGIHPWLLDSDWPAQVDALAQLALGDTRILAIGECGFDRLRGPEVRLQQAAFAAQARVARELGIPVILHCVRGLDLLQEFFKSEKNPPAVIWHGWRGKPESAEPLLSRPVFFSFGKELLRPGSLAAAWMIRCPLDRIFLETDDADLEIASVYQAASLLLGLSVEDLSQQLISNWNHLSNRKIG
jgi:TatD DNase family protein